MVLRVRPTLTRFSTPDGHHTLAFYIKYVPPLGLVQQLRETTTCDTQAPSLGGHYQEDACFVPMVRN